MQTNRVAITAAVISTVALSLAILAASWLTDPIRIVLGLPVLFFFPGHLALRALGTELPPVENVLVSAALSIAICLVGGFVLYGLSALNPIGWALWMLFVVSALSVRVWVYGSVGGLAIQWPATRRWHVLAFVVAGIVAGSAYALALHDQETIREFSDTEFWMISTYPGKLIVGVKNMEGRPQTYEVSVVSKDGPIAEYHSINLNPGETWTQMVVSRYRTEATLYLDHGGKRTVYRHTSAAGVEPELEK